MSEERYHVIDHVDDYVHEVVTPEYATYLEEHCQRCSMCRAALDEARKRHAALETVPAVEASEELVRKTLDHITREDRNARRRRRLIAWTVLPALAASVLILAGLNIYYARLTPSPYSVVVVGQNSLFSGANGSLRIRVINQSTGAALAGVPVDVELHGKAPEQVAKLASFTTDAQGTGTPRFQMPDWADGEYRLRVVARTSGGAEELTERVRLKRAWKLMLSSDKPVYQPGQTILVRSLALRKPNLKPVAGEPALFTVADPKGNIIFKQQDPTSSFGIGSIKCELANEILEGPYTIACKVGDTESKLTVDVKKYVLPKFKIETKGLEPYYAPGQRVSGMVKADYFFGKPVAGGEVKIKVVTTDVGPATERELTAKTNDAGEAEFQFRLPERMVGRPRDSGDARFALEITVIDTAGQKQTKAVTRTVTTNPLRVEVIPEGGTLVAGEPNTIYLFASYADGRPAAKARVTITGIEKELTTNSLGIASFSHTPPAPTRTTPVQGKSYAVVTATPYADTHLTIKVTDEKGQTISYSTSLPVGQVTQDFLVRTDKAVYNGGETVKVAALGGGVEPVFLDFIKDGQTILTESIDMTGGKGEYQFDLPAEVFGTLEMVAYRFGKDGLPVRKSRVLYVRAADQIKISAALDKKEYRPGKKAVLEFQLTDKEGKPAPGALSVAAVDEAVFAVLEQAPGMERLFYTLEREMLKPVYAIYPWSPDLSGVQPEERRELEQALFSTTARTETGRQAGSPLTRKPGGNAGADRSPYTLTANSFPAHVQEVKQARETGLARVKTGWIALGVVLGLAALFGLCQLVGPKVVSGFQSMAESLQTTQTQRSEQGRGSSGGSWLPHLVIIAVLLIVFSLVAITAIGTRANATFATVASSLSSSGGWARSAPRAADADEGRAPAMIMKTEAPVPIETKPQGQDAPAAEPVRVREWFPETLLWQPQLVTDNNGRAHIHIELADSITTWRVTASAVTGDGRLGAEQSSITVFQPFFVDLNLPVTMTRNDEVSVPVVVYNYLDRAQKVDLSLAAGNWFELQDDAKKTIELGPRQVLSTSYRLRVNKVGNFDLQVTARGEAGVADAILRKIEVVPDGRRIDQVHNGNLQQPVELTLNVPQGAIEGSPKAIVKIYPSNFSQLVEGLDNIFRMPYGCFEQTSSTTYPNVLALDYLKRTGKKSPEVEAKAKQYIHLGYQRLVSFEVQGGGFDWFGRPPANLRLTAYGLMEFQDMAKVHDVDPNLIARTRSWLLSKRDNDGSWPWSHGLHAEADPATGRGADMARYATTAYVAWAVFGGQPATSEGAPTLRYLLSVSPEQLKDPYLLAVTCNALLALDSTGSSAAPYLKQLDSLKRSSDDGKRTWWEQAANSRTTFYGGGRSGHIETTALAALAMLQANGYTGSTRGALTWLTEQKDPNGTWFSTQATVLALKALVNGTGKALGGEKERRIEITLGNGKKHEIVIPADQADVMKQLDLSTELVGGDNKLSIREISDTGAGYQAAFRYHMPAAGEPNKNEPLAVSISYDKTELAVGDVVIAEATVVNRMPTAAPMVILDLPIPAGFAIGSDQLEELKGSGLIAKYQITARKAIVYLRGLEPNKPLKLRYDLKATMPVKVAVQPARAYEYYDPDKQGTSRPAQMTVNARK